MYPLGISLAHAWQALGRCLAKMKRELNPDGGGGGRWLRGGAGVGRGEGWAGREVVWVWGWQILTWT